MSYMFARNFYSDTFNRPTCVYRFYDAADQLLYVGLSVNFKNRRNAHRRREWWPTVAREEVVWFDGREDAKAAEREALATESPLHNITGVVRQ